MSSPQRHLRLLLALVLGAPLLGCQWHWVNPVTVLAAETTQPAAPNKWEKDIEKFEAADAKEMPPKDCIDFLGSSTIRFWEVKKAFPDLPVINRGFGGSEMSDAAEFESRIASKYQPRLVVLYEGDNDLNAGKKPADIFSDYSKFADHLHAESPNTKMIVISIKPSPSRWKLMPLMTETNKLIEEDAKARGWVTYFNAVPLLLGQDGTPPKGLFRADGLHMNEQGYKLWDDAIRPLLNQ